VKAFLEALADGPLLFDGAMGSLLYERGVLHTRSYDELNLSQPELIRKLHRDYLDAGADIIETNTFGANRVALARHGHSARVEAINRAGVALAREVVDDVGYVAGAVGPTGINMAIASPGDRDAVERALREQIEILGDAGIDLLLLETFYSILEIELALRVAREVSELPIVAQMVFTSSGVTEDGLEPSEVAERLIAGGAQIIGANCGTGPQELYPVASAMVGHGVPVSVQPNAGLPSVVDGRTIYVANPEHFGVFARRMLKSGVRLIGGCCGTTPEHTRAMLGAVKMMGGSNAASARLARARPPTIEPEARPAVVPLAERSRLGARIAAGEFAVSVELTGPTGTDPSKVLAGVEEVVTGGVDIINIADGPRATARMSNLAFCTLAQKTGVEPILHVCCRDKNYLGLVSHLLGAHALGIRNLVIITGDPPKMGDYPFATPVYDVDSIGLLEIARALNAGYEPSGKELGCHTSFVLATGAEPAAADYERELRRLEQKRDAGAELVMTQPVYDPRTLERFLDDVEPLGLPVMVGLLPLASHRNAEFLHNEVPGMQIPASYRERMAAVGSGPEARAEGVAIAREALSGVLDRVAGAYIMPPFNRVESALAILEVAGERWKPAAKRRVV
jgi:homocysteine S-methyltransferase